MPDLGGEVALGVYFDPDVVAEDEVSVEGARLHVVDVACEVRNVVDEAVALPEVVQPLELHHRFRSDLTVRTYLADGHILAGCVYVL